MVVVTQATVVAILDMEATLVMVVAILVTVAATLAMVVATLDAVATAVAVAGHTTEVAEGAAITLVKLLLHKLRMRLTIETSQINVVL